jgi:autotransporter translocation and assembly factor TamB
MIGRRLPLTLVAALMLIAGLAFSAEVTGTWTAAIDTQIGVQNYTYTFKAEGGKLTGTAKSQFGETQIAEGAVNGDEISFVENLDFQGQPLRIVYKGKISGDEIKFTRQVGDVASEDFVAKRSK